MSGMATVVSLVTTRCCLTDLQLNVVKTAIMNPAVMNIFFNVIIIYKYGAVKPSARIPDLTSGQLVNRFHNNFDR